MARGLLGFTQVFTLPAQMLALSLPPSDHALPSEPRRRRGTAIVWRPHTEGFATIAYRDGRAIAGISGPWSNQYVLIWWQPAQPIHEVQVFDSLDEARRAEQQDRRGLRRALVDQRDNEARPDHRGDDEAVAEHDDDGEFRHAVHAGAEQLREAVRRHDAGIAELDREHARDRREERHDDGGVFGWLANLIDILPLAVLAPILIFVAINITMQAFEATPHKYFAAVVMAFFPPIARMLAIKLGDPGIVPPEQFGHLFALADRGLPEIAVVVILGNGFIITSMVWASFVVALIDHRPAKAAAILLLGAALTVFGIIHSVDPNGTLYLPWDLAGSARELVWQFAGAYMVLAAVLGLLALWQPAMSAADTSEHSARQGTATPP